MCADRTLTLVACLAMLSSHWSTTIQRWLTSCKVVQPHRNVCRQNADGTSSFTASFLETSSSFTFTACARPWWSPSLTFNACMKKSAQSCYALTPFLQSPFVFTSDILAPSHLHMLIIFFAPSSFTASFFETSSYISLLATYLTRLLLALGPSVV